MQSVRIQVGGFVEKAARAAVGAIAEIAERAIRAEDERNDLRRRLTEERRRRLDTEDSLQGLLQGVAEVLERRGYCPGETFVTFIERLASERDEALQLVADLKAANQCERASWAKAYADAVTLLNARARERNRARDGLRAAMAIIASEHVCDVCDTSTGAHESGCVYVLALADEVTS